MGLLREIFYNSHNSQGDDTIQLEHLTDYREKAIVAAYLGFCMDCFSDYYMDKTVTDKDRNSKKVKFKKITYIDLANTFEKNLA